MKKVLTFVMVGVLMLTCSMGIYAAAPETIIPLWDNIYSMPMSFSFDGTNGTVSASVTGKSGVTTISGTLTIYEKTSTGWRYVSSDSDTVEARSMTLSVSFTGVANVEYKAVFDVSVTRNGVVEPETKTVYKTC
ncbi:MAG: hypothetical protein IKY52_14480 [Clostridia bacterium]|nr:hypothetical protein [Clostridia bacterium]